MRTFFNKIINMIKPVSDGLSAEGYFNLGSSAFKEKDYLRAIKYYTKSIKLDGKLTEPYRSRAISYLRIKKNEKALKDYNMAISISPAVKELYRDRGLVYFKLHKYNEAISDYNSAIKIDSEYDKAYLWRGLTYLSLNDFENALSDMGKAIEYEKENGAILEPYINKCKMLMKNPKSLLDDFLNNPIVKEQQSIYDFQRKMIDEMKSTDQDEIPWGIGEFGYDASNPIPTNTSFGSISYLARLQTMTGEKVIYNRLGSTQVQNIDNPVDIYEISDTNGFICKLYVSMYHRKVSEKIPRNFKRA